MHAVQGHAWVQAGSNSRSYLEGFLTFGIWRATGVGVLLLSAVLVALLLGVAK